MMTDKPMATGIAPASAVGEAAAGLDPLAGPAAAPVCSQCGGAPLPHRTTPICEYCLHALEWRYEEAHRAVTALGRTAPVGAPWGSDDSGWRVARGTAIAACLDLAVALRRAIGADVRMSGTCPPPPTDGLRKNWTGD